MQLHGEGGQLGIDRQQNALPAGQLRAEVIGQIQLGKDPLVPPLRRQGQPTQPGQTLAAQGESDALPRQGLALAAEAAGRFLSLGRDPYDGQCAAIAGEIAVQAGAERPGIAAVGLDPLAVGAPVARAHNQIMHSHGEQPTVQHVAERTGLVAAVNAIGLGQLARTNEINPSSLNR